MSGQRARSAVPADHRSVHPLFPGLPWWGAVVLAFTVTAVGFAFDAGSGSRELGSVFSACYVLGCLLAVLAVRQAGLFTAVIQPPLLLFVTVPGAYFLFHGSEIHGLKDLAINCGYPLIERFPLMFFTSAAVLLIGMGRWYLGMSSRHATGTSAPAAKGAKGTTRDVSKGASAAAAAGGLVAALKTKVSGLLSAPAATDDGHGQDEEPPRRRRSSERPRRAAKPAAERTRSSRDAARGAAARKPAKRAATPSRSRHNRPPETEIIEPVVDRPRRSRSTPRTPESPEPRRRSRTQAPREAREPRETRDARKLPPRERRSSSYDRPERRPERSRRLDDYEPYEPLEPHTRNGSSSHHPISRVRYRGADEDDQRSEYRSRPRVRRSWDADAWEYDV
ncbi:DUF6542 domain-containing protein [Mycolicibacterium monacense]|uniref:DUF6542 domain-containing protein n=1 Tax=Mycolicibacterium monacense TaxID=85693 RepID=UPI0009F71A14|nr:DUF6542 domain-containing protein [Mycolicibacterium monacense]MDA4101204.1 hypothetical protein [Mycolicibacterium monacense DSM 44395]ORB18947.1 hypothetical protein BST34_16410 [Mycolicibacterium monacense DSM 44395]QHP87843.1 hypothetical protein EWR22_22225 [Mycolicibacterium monacense DSM 44395]